ncbi:unnamed protein product [Paramecium sonneborni]|uniref:arginyltransferase n=1 Tax=Paramecium sonneborni TaxID=65129 RepID=A0A8S1PUA2_9CILI|nr:unnamed protein product [Paramecium sonneborni]
MGCCLYTSTHEPVQENNYQIIMPKSVTYLKVLKSQKSSCLYECGKHQYIYYLHPYSNFSIEILELLLDRGFVRNAKYFRKYNHHNSCCLGYNSRVNVQENLPTKKQKTIINNFIDDVIKKYPNLDFKEKSKLNKEDNQPQQVINKQLKQQSKKVQKIVNLEDVQELMNEIQIILISCCKMINEEIDQNLNFEIVNQYQLKIFENDDDLGYYTNHNLILYDQNIKLLKSKQIVQQQFNKMLGIKLNEKVIMKEYKLLQNKDGYFNILKIGREQQQRKKEGNKKQQNNEGKKKEKQEKGQVKEVLNQINVIDDQSFTLNDFKIGDMTIKIVDPYQSEENVTLYLNYMAQVHNSQSSLESFTNYYATRIILADQCIQNKSQNVKLILGQRFMEYQIKGKLIGCGVIELTKTQLLSEYLFYDPSLKPYSFGVFAAFVEMEYVRRVQKYFPNFKYSSLSYIISTCQAMNYKLQFKGLEIQCPDSYVWMKYNKEIKKLMKSNTSRLNKDVLIKMNKTYDLKECQIYTQNNYYQLSQLDQEKQNQIIWILNQNIDVLGEDLIKGLTFLY